MTVFRGKKVIPGRAEGRAMVTSEPIGFWGGVNYETGEVVDPRHELFGACIKDRVLVFPYGKGSSSGCGALLEMLRCRVAPAAMINCITEPILALGPIIARHLYQRSFPIVVLSREEMSAINSNDHLVVDGDEGTVTIVRRYKP